MSVFHRLFRRHLFTQVGNAHAAFQGLVVLEMQLRNAEKFDACMAEYNALAKKIPALEQEWLELSEKMEANAHE